MLERINAAVNDFVWGPVMLAAFLGVGLMFTVRLGLFQLVHIRLWMRTTLGSIFKRRRADTPRDAHAITQFQALSTALAATVGTGNIAGVASAIALGGPGAVFWMWVSAFLGMMTGFAEKTLGIRYRYRNEKGDWVGGAMVYMERGLNKRWMALLFSAFCVLASLGIGNMTQINSISGVLWDSFGVKPLVTGFVGALLVGLVIAGGLVRIARLTEKLVPFMVVMYALGALVCIGAHIRAVPGALALIFREAFAARSLAGGILGYGVAQAMRRGISRGVFSNEAGLGSSVMAHAAADVKEPVEQGMWGILEVFVDTLVMCTLTALVILTSGAYDMGTYMKDLLLGEPVIQGAVLTANAVAQTLGAGGRYFVAVSLTLFAFSTLIGWSYYGERSAAYVFGERSVPWYKALFVAFVFVGAVSELTLVWGLSDTFNGLMAIPNLIAITLLSGEVVGMTRAYLRHRT